MNGKTVVSSLGAAGVAARGHGRPGPQRPQHVRQRRAADRVDGARPAFRFERPALGGHLVARQDPGRAQRAQSRRLVGLAGRRPDLVAAVGEDRQRRAADAARWRPVTRTGPSAGVRPRSSSATTDIAAVNPAVPIAIASRGVRPGASGTTQPAGTRWYSRVAAVARHAELVAVGEDAATPPRSPGRSLATTSPARSMPGMSGLIRATLPSARVARPSL